MNQQLNGIVAIITYYTQKLFDKLYSQIQEVTEAQIDSELAEAWRSAFNETPPSV